MMRIERIEFPDQRLEARGYKRALCFGTLEIHWRAPDGRVISEREALAQLDEQEAEEER